MNKIIEKTGTGVMYALMALCVILYFFCSTETSPMADGSWVDMTLNFSIGVLALALILAVVAEIANAFSDTKVLIRTGISVVGAVILLGLFWSLADGTPLNLIGYEGDQNTEGWLKLADTGIFTCYFTLIAAVGAIIVSEIIQLFR